MTLASISLPQPCSLVQRQRYSTSEVITLALFSQWRAFESERAFYRYACRHLRPAFPTLPARSQFNRLVRRHHDAIVAFALALGQQMSVPSVG